MLWISWNDTQAFCDWLNKKCPGRYLVRLPGEAEWEYACRAGSTTKYHFGDDPEKFPEYDNVADATLAKTNGGAIDGIEGSDGFAGTSLVGTFKPNAFGLYDMHGNASEWCQDTYGRHSDLPTTNNSIQTMASDHHVTKGGAYDFTVMRLPLSLPLEILEQIRRRLHGLSYRCGRKRPLTSAGPLQELMPSLSPSFRSAVLIPFVT